jgi:hypothetical protein
VHCCSLKPAILKSEKLYINSSNSTWIYPLPDGEQTSSQNVGLIETQYDCYSCMNVCMGSIIRTDVLFVYLFLYFTAVAAVRP